MRAITQKPLSKVHQILDPMEQLKEQIGDIKDLKTNATGNVVDAANELLRRLIITDTCGMIGERGAEVEIQDLLDEIADRVMEKLLEKTGDSQDNIVTFTSNDNADAESWTDVSVLKAKETHKSLLQKISTMFKNIRFLYKKTKKLEIDDKINIARFKRTSSSSTQYGITVNSHAPGDLSINVGSANDTSGKIDLPFSFGFDANGNAGFRKPGADTVTPFLSRLQYDNVAFAIAHRTLSGNIFFNKLSQSSNNIEIIILGQPSSTNSMSETAILILSDQTEYKKTKYKSEEQYSSFAESIIAFFKGICWVNVFELTEDDMIEIIGVKKGYTLYHGFIVDNTNNRFYMV